MIFWTLAFSSPSLLLLVLAEQCSPLLHFDAKYRSVLSSHEMWVSWTVIRHLKCKLWHLHKTFWYIKCARRLYYVTHPAKQIFHTIKLKIFLTPKRSATSTFAYLGLHRLAVRHYGSGRPRLSLSYCTAGHPTTVLPAQTIEEIPRDENKHKRLFAKISQGCLISK